MLAIPPRWTLDVDNDAALLFVHKDLACLMESLYTRDRNVRRRGEERILDKLNHLDNGSYLSEEKEGR